MPLGATFRTVPLDVLSRAVREIVLLAVVDQPTVNLRERLWRLPLWHHHDPLPIDSIDVEQVLGNLKTVLASTDHELQLIFIFVKQALNDAGLMPSPFVAFVPLRVFGSGRCRVAHFRADRHQVTL